MNRNLLLRIASALVLLPIVIVVVHLGGWALWALCLLSTGIVLSEYGGIVAPEDRASRAALILLGAAVCGVGMLTQDATVAFVLLQVGAMAMALIFTLRTGEFETAWPRMTALAFGLPYCVGAFVSVYRLRELGSPLELEWARPTWLYVVLLATWSNDTFAYFAGRAFGKHKLYEKVSPKKTWEGFAGGAVGSVSMLFVAQLVFPNAFGHFTAVDMLFIGIPAAALAPLGDLAESLLKRNYGVKDSGNTIPGHGGMLDRVDAVFVVAPWALLYAVGIRPLLGLG